MGELAALAAAFTWSASSVMLTSLSSRTAPAVLSALRLAFGSTVLVIIVLLTGDYREYGGLDALAFFALIGSGISAYMIGDTLYIWALNAIGMQRTFPVSMALFILLSVAGGVVLLDEPFSWGLVGGGLLIGAGIYMVVLRRAPPSETEVTDTQVRRNSMKTALWLLPVVGITWASATLLLASSKEELGAIAAGTIRIPAGAVGLLLFTATVQRQDLIVPFRRKSHIGLIALTGIAGTGVGSLLYVFSVLEAGAARAVVLNATSPLMAVPLSIIFLGERLTRPVATGTVLCVAGVLLVVA